MTDTEAVAIVGTLLADFWSGKNQGTAFPETDFSAEDAAGATSRVLEIAARTDPIFAELVQRQAVTNLDRAWRLIQGHV